jgi:hypothetical protein
MWNFLKNNTMNIGNIPCMRNRNERENNRHKEEKTMNKQEMLTDATKYQYHHPCNGVSRQSGSSGGQTMNLQRM